MLTRNRVEFLPEVASLRLVPALFFGLLLSACATPEPDDLRSELSLDQALSATMKVIEREGEGAPELIYIRDRHSLNPGFHRLRPQLAEVQRDNRLLVDYLVEKGWDLLGCEYRYGPLQKDENTRRQYQIVSGRLKFDHPNYLDGFSVFQPIRHQLRHGDRLSVWGVEDADLYEKDVDLLVRYRSATKLSTRRDLNDRQRRDALKDALAAADALDENLAARGRAAAENLVSVMTEGKHARAILILGGAHVAGIRAVFRESGRPFLILESPSYEKPRRAKNE